MERTRWLMVFVLVFGLTAGVANAVPIAEEPFYYPAGALDGQNTGTGFDGAWSGDVYVVEAGTLTHATLDIATSGNKIVGDAGGVIGRDFPADTFVDDGTTYWFSALILHDGVSTSWISPFGFGLCVFYIEGDVTGIWDGTVWEEVTFDFPANEVVWVVIKLETDGGGENETAYVFINPDPDTAPDNGAAVGSIPVGAMTDDVGIEIYVEGQGEPVAVRIDEMRWGTAYEDIVCPLCDSATNPSPQNREENVDPALALLEWVPPAGICNPLYDVYFGTDSTVANNPKILDGSLTASVEPNDPAVEYSLALDTQYYWRVDVNDPNCDDQCQNCVPGYVMLTGSTWDFTTWPYEPVILTQPENNLVPPDGTAQFDIVSGGNLAGSHTFTWYKQVGAEQDEPNDVIMKGPTGPTGSDTLTITGAQYGADTYAITATADQGSGIVRATTADHGGDIAAGLYVTIAGTTDYNGRHLVTNVTDNTHFDFAHAFTSSQTGNASLSDEGSYYCKVTNTVPGTTYSDSAGLVLMRLMAWYKLGNADDSASNYHGTRMGTFGTGLGIDGLSLRLDGSTAYMDVPHVIGESVGTFEDFTISAWVNPDPGEGHGVIWVGYDDTAGGPPSGGEGISIERMANGEALVWIEGNDPETISSVANAIPQDEWTHVVFVYDSNDAVGTGTLYINGEQAEQEEYVSASAQQIGPIIMGAYQPDGGPMRWFLDGRLDEVRFYAYPITAVNVASLYNEMTSDPVCAGNPEADLDDSCTVELVDYAKMLSNWLACNIIPAAGNCP